MKKSTVYECEWCGKQYKNAENALECEKSHIKITRISKVLYHTDFKYPYEIEVECANGNVLKFINE